MPIGNESEHADTNMLYTSAVPVDSIKCDECSKTKVIESMSEKVYGYISQTVPIHSDKVCVVESFQSDWCNKLAEPMLGLVDVCPINLSNNLNVYLKNLNASLPETSIIVGCCMIADIEDKKARRKNKYYKYLKKGKGFYKAETLGRLVYFGFSIIEFKEIEGLLYFMVMKVKEAPGNLNGCSDKILFPMTRIGKDGKKLIVYKVRTMHPYSQYLQNYVVRLNGYNEVGKPANDFRLTPWGKFFRKYWLDELPQLLNLLKGELALVGVRPLSQTRFSELPREVQELRVQFKPGCIPPYVSLLMPDSKGNIEAEMIYMDEKRKKGIRTDVKYFFMAIKNILTGKITSS
ncbi:sugar transferase [Saccharicrinis carchari]|uniref:Sugar transferase n=1 Tax=Saccharicrinis carchari TaxID=1168039 RepID=A0A521D0Q9_SACCC|nr:sugar transferase [Saccharicrinis carchari]SMO65252.1 sugar transferase [Saccharicrinis carchari]